jgi:hypothetical protein
VEDLVMRQTQPTQPFAVPTAQTRLQESPLSAPLYNALPLPNLPASAVNAGPGWAGFVQGFSSPTDQRTSGLRLDHYFSDRLIGFFRYNLAPSHQTQEQYPYPLTQFRVCGQYGHADCRSDAIDQPGARERPARQCQLAECEWQRGFVSANAPLPADEAASIGDLKWFEVFGDERLQSLINTALVSSYDLRDAVARVEEARASLGVTRSNQFPTSSANGDGNQSTVARWPNTITRGRSPSQNHNFGSASLALFSFEIDILGKVRRATEAARANLLSAEQNRKAVVTTLVSEVATGYLTLCELDYALEISLRTLRTREQSMELTGSRQLGGVGTLLDLRQAEQLVDTSAQTIPGRPRVFPPVSSCAGVKPASGPPTHVSSTLYFASQRLASRVTAADGGGELERGVEEITSILSRTQSIRCGRQSKLGSFR